MRAILILPLFLLAAGCALQGGLPPVVVELYDRVEPAGCIEIEAERDGSIREVEAEIPTADLPAAVLAAAEKELPGGRVTGAEIEYVGGMRSWEVKKVVDGREFELVFDETGKLLEKEEAIERSAAPAPVMQAAMGRIVGAGFKSVERIMRLGETEYHVKVTKGGATYKMVLTPAGKILRAVREQRAEIEIPLE